MKCTEKLLAISSECLCSKPEVMPELLRQYSLGLELFRMLQIKNGFYAFESALHVFPVRRTAGDDLDLETWNSDELWRNAYLDRAQGLVFFAEDIFQDQFCISSRGVLRFTAETGETVFLANSVEDWACSVLSDFAHETGWPLANEWQVKNGPLPRGKRLMPKTPFFLGGDYGLPNLWVGDSVEGMRFKADMATQTRDLPTGTEVRLRIQKEPEKGNA